MHEIKSKEELKESALNKAYAIRNYMMPILPVKMLQKDWKNVQFSDYYLHNNKKLYGMETKIVEGEDGTFYYMFKTRAEKYLFPLSHVRLPFKLSVITKYIYAQIPIDALEKKGDKEYADSIRTRCIDRAIAIWMKNMITGQKLSSLYNNMYKDLLLQFEELVKRRHFTNMSLVACVIDRKNSRYRDKEDKFADVLKKNYFEKRCLVYMINQRGEIIQECTEYEENSVKGVDNYNILGKEFSQFLDLCSSNTEKENQAYIAIALTRNGDLFIIDTGRIEMIKRNDKWHNVNFAYFRHAIKNSLENISELLIRHLYFSVIKANMEYTNMAIAIVHPEDAKEYSEILKAKNTYKVEDRKLQKMRVEDEFETLRTTELISITEEGKIISRNRFDDFNLRDEKELLHALSNYALIIRVRKDYNIKIYERDNLIYSTD